MGRQHNASSQVAWAIIAEGVAKSRVETHRLQQSLLRAQKLVETSTHREHIHQVAGDLLRDIPERINKLERALDRTNYALSLMGTEFLRNRIPQDDKTEVDEAVESVPLPLSQSHSASSRRVASRHING